jgi:hypothetical protein
MEGVPQYLVRDLRSALLAKPFAPFALVMKDGRRYDVGRQFACAYAGDLVVISQPGGLVRRRFHDVASVDVQQPVGGG